MLFQVYSRATHFDPKQDPASSNFVGMYYFAVTHKSADDYPPADV
jgi:hypothetical protein